MVEWLNQLTNGNAPVALAVVLVLIALLLARVLRRMRPALERSAVGARNAMYLATAVQGWILTTLILLVMWVEALRDEVSAPEMLQRIGLHAGLPWTETVIWSVGMILAITAVSYSVARIRRYFGGKPTAAGLNILPETPAETAVFSLMVAPTAGIGEEIVYRGFLLGHLWWITNDGWLAAALSSLVFGGLHIYQGWWGVLRTGVIGMILAAGVVVTGSLIPSIIAHTLGNMLSAVIRKPMAPQPASL